MILMMLKIILQLKIHFTILSSAPFIDLYLAWWPTFQFGTLNSVAFPDEMISLVKVSLQDDEEMTTTSPRKPGKNQFKILQLINSPARECTPGEQDSSSWIWFPLITRGNEQANAVRLYAKKLPGADMPGPRTTCSMADQLTSESSRIFLRSSQQLSSSRPSSSPSVTSSSRCHDPCSAWIVSRRPTLLDYCWRWPGQSRTRIKVDSRPLDWREKL